MLLRIKLGTLRLTLPVKVRSQNFQFPIGMTLQDGFPVWKVGAAPPTLNSQSKIMAMCINIKM